MKTSRLLSFAGIAAIALAASAARADIHISAGNIPGDNLENVLFQIDQPTGPNQVGITNQTGFLVNFSSDEDLDVTGSQGQARIEAVDGGLNNICISLDEPMAGYRRIVMNLFNPTFTTGLVFFTVTEMDGTVNNFEMDLDGSGQNFFTIWATNGQVIREVCFVTEADLIDLRQVRIGGAHIIPGPAAVIPFAIGLVGAMRRRRSTK